MFLETALRPPGCDCCIPHVPHLPKGSLTCPVKRWRVIVKNTVYLFVGLYVPLAIFSYAISVEKKDFKNDTWRNIKFPSTKKATLRIIPHKKLTLMFGMAVYLVPFVLIKVWL
jgi:hypothetical protein